MSLQPVKTALKYASAWSLVAAFVALLAIIFSFLGALFCAALGGMMMGATKASARLSVFYSLLCPGVLFAVMRSQKTELAQRQILVLVLICLAVFWAIYLLSAALMAQEQKSVVASGKVAPASNVELPMADTGLARHSCGQPGPPPNPRAVNGVAQLLPQSLEGYWCCEVCGRDGRPQKRILEIKDGALILSTLDEEGHLCSCAEGRLNWISSPPTGALVLSALAEEAFPSPAI